MPKQISDILLFESIRLAIKLPVCFAVIVLTAYLTKDIAATKAVAFAILLGDVPGMVVHFARMARVISSGYGGDIQSPDFSRNGRLLTFLSGTVLIAFQLDGEHAVAAQIVLMAGLTVFFLALDAMRRRMGG